MTIASKETVKKILGEIPFTAELYWLVRQHGKPIKTRFSLRHLEEHLPVLLSQVKELRKDKPAGKNIFIFSTLHYWIEHTSLLGLGFSAMGNNVTLGYLPYGDWFTPTNRFDLRRQNAYARELLGNLEPYVHPVSFLSRRTLLVNLPSELEKIVEEISVFDYQYTLQTEQIDRQSTLFKLRLHRNMEAARAAYFWLRQRRPEVVVMPNGTVQEFGVVYRIARAMKIPVVTYEFSDQRQTIWLAQNSEIMHQDTDDFWEAFGTKKLVPAEKERIHGMYDARQKGELWENFTRRWQQTPTIGKDEVRQALNLDDRPVVVLATNVLGDSLTLGREVFSRTMSEWVVRTVQYFLGRPGVQLVVRIHPGEIYTKTGSMMDVIREMLPDLPEHIRIVAPTDPVNTYDLVHIANFGLVYTTTVGMEMAMLGLPVIVSGQTHYRNRGFTNDPESWVAYFKMLGAALERPEEFKLSPEQIEKAWQYAYRFFFDFPRPFPWHLHVWEHFQEDTFRQAFQPDQWQKFGPTFQALTGDRIDWDAIANSASK